MMKAALQSAPSSTYLSPNNNNTLRDGSLRLCDGLLQLIQFFFGGLELMSVCEEKNSGGCFRGLGVILMRLHRL